MKPDLLGRVERFLSLVNIPPSPHPFMTFFDELYPERLKQLHQAPWVLYYLGKSGFLQHPGPWIGVVGTRRASYYGKEVCRQLIKGLQSLEPVIVSGMAEGIDGMAHDTALKEGMETVGVLGTSLNRVFPSFHRALQKKMGEEALLLSEIYPGAPMGPWRFPERNRLIAALCDAIVVVEAPEKSGALVTAQMALDMGREVFVVPGPVDSPRNRGGHRWIQQGASLLRGPEDLLEFFGQSFKVSPSHSKKENLTAKSETLKLLPQEEEILRLLEAGDLHIDKIAHMGHLPAPLASSLLTGLSLKGLVHEHQGKVFKKV